MAVEQTNAAPIPLARGALMLLRLEGLAAAAITAVAYAHTGAGWWMFALLWLAPDLSMIAYLGDGRRAAQIYNAVHSYVLPATLGLSAFLLHADGLIPAALAWANHIGVDRMLGYGLKSSRSFAWTHLGPVGSARTALKRDRAPHAVAE